MKFRREHAEGGNRWRCVLSYLGVALFWLLVWEGCAKLVNRSLLLPDPIAVFRHLAALLPQLSFWQTTGSTLVRILIGWLAGCLVGGLLAGLTWRWRVADRLLSPAFTVIRATPVASFILIAIVWMGAGRVPSFTSFLMVLPIVWGTTRAALQGMDQKLYEVTTVFRFSPARRMRYLYLPTAMPGFLSGCVTSVGLGWKAGVAAEVLCATKQSIGRYLYESKIYLETADLFAWTLVVIVMSMILEWLIRTAAYAVKGRKSS